MSMISEQVKYLRKFDCFGTVKQAMLEAADTIEALSAKLQAENFGGWISCKERLPKEKDGLVLICESNGEVRTGIYSEYSSTWYKGEMCEVGGCEVIAWQPLPEEYHG